MFGCEVALHVYSCLGTTTHQYRQLYFKINEQNGPPYVVTRKVRPVLLPSNRSMTFVCNLGAKGRLPQTELQLESVCSSFAPNFTGRLFSDEKLPSGSCSNSFCSISREANSGDPQPASKFSDTLFGCCHSPAKPIKTIAELIVTAQPSHGKSQLTF